MEYYSRPTERDASPPRRRRSVPEKTKDAIEGLIPGHYAELKRPRHGHSQHHERGRPHRYGYGSYDDDDDDDDDGGNRYSDSGGYGVNAEGRRRRQQQQQRRPRSRARRRSSDSGPNWKQATEAAVGAALIEGWHARHTADRNTRVATAAAGAAAIDLAIGHEHDRKNKRHALESTIGGLMIDRVVNGPSKR